MGEWAIVEGSFGPAAIENIGGRAVQRPPFYQGVPVTRGQIVKLGSRNDLLLIERGRLRPVSEATERQFFKKGKPPVMCRVACGGFFLNDADELAHWEQAHRADLEYAKAQLAKAQRRLTDAEAAAEQARADMAPLQAEIAEFEGRVAKLEGRQPPVSEEAMSTGGGDQEEATEAPPSRSGRRLQITREGVSQV